MIEERRNGDGRYGQKEAPEAVVLAAQDLGRDVVGRAAEGGGGVAGADALLAHAVVGELDVALVVEEDVVQLQIAVDDALLVEEVERQRDLGRVEAGVLLGQAPLALHVEHQVAAAHELDDEEEARRRLEARVQPHQKRVVRRRLEDVLLRLHPVNVLSPYPQIKSHPFQIQSNSIQSNPDPVWFHQL